MVNASLNWASIVGIVLAVCGGGLYFLRSFKLPWRGIMMFSSQQLDFCVEEYYFFKAGG